MMSATMRIFEQMLLYAGIVCEAILITIMWRRGDVRRLPVFAFYLVWVILSDVAAAVMAHGNTAGYARFYRAEYVADVLVQFLVLVELARGVLQPLPTLIGRGAVLILLLINGGAGALLWHLSARWIQTPSWSADWSFLLRMQLSSSLLRIVFLLILSGIAELLSRNLIPIGWGDRELQVATGLGIYALVSLATSLRLCYPVSVGVYVAMGAAVAVSFFGVEVYWIVSFLKPERSWLPSVAAACGDAAAGDAQGREEASEGRLQMPMTVPRPAPFRLS